MNNDKGKLYYGLGLDNNQLRADAAESRNIIKGIGDTAVSEGNRIDSISHRIGAALAVAFSAQQATAFARSIVQVTGEMQQLDVAFTTMLNSKAKSDALLSQAVNFAAKTPMIYFSGVDGSGQLAKGNITWDSAGNIKANGGTFTDILIQGSLRSPFVRETDSIVIGGKQSTHDNVVPIASGGGWVTVGTLEWGVEQSGRRMCIANYRWGSEITTGSIEYSAPSGKYFYEDGTQKKAISLSRECVELMGYGTSTQFYGWIVLNRINLMTTSKYGRKLNVLAQGIVTGYSSGASISYKSYDNASTLSVSRQGTGKYRVNFPSNWGLITGSYIVMMTGYGSGLMKATLLEAGTSYFIAEVSDDSSANDGSFMFQIINLNDWLVL